MKFDELFEHRSLVASKLKECLLDKGYTKVSFAKKAEISLPTLDQLLNGGIDDKTTFEGLLQKILKILDMSVDELMLYSEQQTNPAIKICIQNNHEDSEMSDNARKKYELLMDIIDLFAAYD